DTPSGRHAFWPTRLLADTPSGRHAFWPTRLLADTPSGRHAFWPTRLLAAILTIVACSGLFAPDLQAQNENPPCLYAIDDDICQENFAYDTSVVRIPNTNCWVRIAYRHRSACQGKWYDLIIDDITPVNSACNGFIISQLVVSATQALIDANPMGFPPLQPGPFGGTYCQSITRTFVPPCWKWNPNSNESDPVSCGESPCCYAYWDVCMDEHGNRTSRARGSAQLDGSPQCDPGNIFDIRGCTGVCPDFTLYSGRTAPEPDPSLSTK
ncbi:MAG: hypothetical protein K1X90_13785, partial [Candidatus Kapabacteria bacterium]|nr:hypothetical protein [Candidatus Kapabacteria bacterium]